MSTAVFCIVKSEDQAYGIVLDLKMAGFSSDDVSVLLADQGSTREFAHTQQTKAPEGATAGAGTGGAVGAALGWLAGVGALAIPGLGPFVAAGPIMAALSGAAVGATVGGVTGALIGYGVPEFEAKRYEGRVKDGGILISVHCDDGDWADKAKQILEATGAEDVSEASEAKVSGR
jgi:hypothetical protein